LLGTILLFSNTRVKHCRSTFYLTIHHSRYCKYFWSNKGWIIKSPPTAQIIAAI